MYSIHSRTKLNIHLGNLFYDSSVGKVPQSNQCVKQTTRAPARLKLGEATVHKLEVLKSPESCKSSYMSN